MRPTGTSKPVGDPFKPFLLKAATDVGNARLRQALAKEGGIGTALQGGPNGRMKRGGKGFTGTRLRTRNVVARSTSGKVKK